MNEFKIDHNLADWILNLEKLNTEQKIRGINPVLINLLKSIMRGHYTPEQLKADFETYMTREEFRGWHWTKQNEQYLEVHKCKYTQLMTKEREHGFI